MVDETFYKCVGGPLNGMEVSALVGDGRVRIPNSEALPFDLFLDEEEMTHFHDYELIDHPEHGTAWVWPKD